MHLIQMQHVCNDLVLKNSGTVRNGLGQESRLTLVSADVGGKLWLKSAVKYGWIQGSLAWVKESSREPVILSTDSMAAVHLQRPAADSIVPGGDCLDSRNGQ